MIEESKVPECNFLIEGRFQEYRNIFNPTCGFIIIYFNVNIKLIIYKQLLIDYLVNKLHYCLIFANLYIIFSTTHSL